VIKNLVDEADRQLLMLWMLGVNHRVIAEQLGLTEGAVRVRWHRLRATLRDALTEEAGHGRRTRDA
jgi:DNA-directed RNA polymerase specialized sigma24 family protein